MEAVFFYRMIFPTTYTFLAHQKNVFHKYFENIWGEVAMCIYESPGYKIVQTLTSSMPKCP